MGKAGYLAQCPALPIKMPSPTVPSFFGLGRAIFCWAWAGALGFMLTPSKNATQRKFPCHFLSKKNFRLIDATEQKLPWHLKPLSLSNKLV